MVVVGGLTYLLLKSVQKIELYEDFILSRRTAYRQLLGRIRELDNKEMFEKDDEVGGTFQDIKNEIEEFSKIIDE